MSDKEICRDRIIKVQVQQDFETCERAGAGGMFQVISLTFIYDDDTKDYRTDLIDQGDMFYTTDEVLRRLGISSDNVDVERV